MSPKPGDAAPSPGDLSGAAKGTTLCMVWFPTLLVSYLPNIILGGICGGVPAWLNWAKLAVIALALGAGRFSKPAKDLRAFMLILSAFHILPWVGSVFLGGLDSQPWLVGAPAFARNMAAVQIPRFASALLMLLLGRILFGSFEGTFFSMGHLAAPATPIAFVLTKPPAWNKLAFMIAGYMCAGLLLFMFVFGRPPEARAWHAVLPMVPLVLVFSATNAFSEEVLFRAPWLAALEKSVGLPQAVLLTATVFGLAHFHGVPYGVVGVVMAFIPGYLMGKAMAETRGFFWAWFIHICLDIVILLTVALGSVTIGGQ